MGARRWIVDQILEYLMQPLPRYERRGQNDLRALKQHVQRADVLLIEGDQRVSAIIRYLTQSSWSHSALYVGDELVRRGGELADWARAEFGDEAGHLVVEALPKGVVAAPLAKYVDYNVRVCRPHKLRSEHVRRVVDEAVGAIGWRYDLRNVLDLARYLIPVSLVPNRWRGTALHFGSRQPTEVICSSLIAQIFQRVPFPILPTITYEDGQEPGPQSAPLVRRIFGQPSGEYTGVFHMRHPTLLTPRDFDLSPYFDIVKFNQIAEGDFDYRRIHWVDQDDAQTA